MPEDEHHYLDTSEKIAAYFDQLSKQGHETCAVDTEADSLHSYETKMCLIQFAVPGSLAIIDPLASGIDLEPMLSFFRSTKAVWMHGADYDMAMFRKTFSWVPEVVWDTQTAARLLGARKYGLANLLETEFGLVVSKSNQKANWGKRPLSEKLIEYAYNDVRYLIELGNRYLDRLQGKGRFAWFEEMCRSARHDAISREERDADEIWRVNGWGRLDTRGLAFLRALWFWRDEECRRLDRPYFKFISNDGLLDLAKRLQQGERVDPPRHIKPAQARRFLKEVTDVRNMPASQYPVKYRKTGGKRMEIDEQKLAEIRQHRDRIAGELDIESTLIATRQSLEILATPDVPAQQKENLLLRWQRALLRDILES